LNFRVVHVLFQSSPVSKDGRYEKVSSTSARTPVSILARLEGRALRKASYCQISGTTCFNPRPSRRTGATNTGLFLYYDETVSILARLEGRALRLPVDVAELCGWVSILARLEGRALLGSSSSGGTAYLFQSSPVSKDGRYRHSSVRRPERWSFNPRPSRRTGATRSLGSPAA